MDLRLMHTVGNLELLKLRKIAFLCSRTCPAGTRKSVLSWAERDHPAASCVLSGFHSRLEKEVLQRLVRGHHPLIMVLARGLGGRLEPELSQALERGRLLILTRYAESVTHPSEESCYQRNRLMMELAAEVVVGYLSPGGKLERLCRDFAGKKPILFLQDPLPTRP